MQTLVRIWMRRYIQKARNLFNVFLAQSEQRHLLDCKPVRPAVDDLDIDLCAALFALKRFPVKDAIIYTIRPIRPLLYLLFKSP